LASFYYLLTYFVSLGSWGPWWSADPVQEPPQPLQQRHWKYYGTKRSQHSQECKHPTDFPDSLCNISVLSLMILAASVSEISCGKTDRHADKRRQKPYPLDFRRRS